MNDFAKALPDLQAALKLKPDDFDTTQRIQYVQAKLATPRPVVSTAPPPPTPAPTPEPMDMRMKIGIGAGALVLIIILLIILSRKKSRGY
jgi:hypothetical protein